MDLSEANHQNNKASFIAYGQSLRCRLYDGEMFKAMFVNLPVENLKRSVEFFSGLGLEFNAQFTDESSTCMLLGENIFAMLVEKPKFSGFTKKQIAAPETVEAILSMSVGSAEEVSRLAEKAFELGAKKVNELEDHGFMVSWGFEDLDGHLWDLFWMNPEHVQG